MPTPCSRFDAATASASPTIALETSASGSTSTIVSLAPPVGLVVEDVGEVALGFT